MFAERGGAGAGQAGDRHRRAHVHLGHLGVRAVPLLDLQPVHQSPLHDAEVELECRITELDLVIEHVEQPTQSLAELTRTEVVEFRGCARLVDNFVDGRCCSHVRHRGARDPCAQLHTRTTFAPMITGEKILVTGVHGAVAFPLASALAADNEVWGVARFTDPATRTKVEQAGITAHVADVASAGLDGLPDDFTYVLHLAYFRGGEDAFDESFRINAEGTGLVLQHCRSARAALVMSSHVIYTPTDDPTHTHREDEPIGGMRAVGAHGAECEGRRGVGRALLRTSLRPAGDHRPAQHRVRTRSPLSAVDERTLGGPW